MKVEICCDGMFRRLLRGDLVLRPLLDNDYNWHLGLGYKDNQDAWVINCLDCNAEVNIIKEGE